MRKISMALLLIFMLLIFVSCEEKPNIEPPKVEPPKVWEEYSIGDRGPAGGWIFYDVDADNYQSYDVYNEWGEVEETIENDPKGKDGLTSLECGWRYLEAAPEDITVNGTGKFIFGYYRPDGTIEFVDGTKEEIGYGMQNTRLLINAMGKEAYLRSTYEGKTSNYAAKLCDDYVCNDYDDWFLPSRDELDEMCKTLKCDGGNYHLKYCTDLSHSAISTDDSKNSFVNHFYWSSSEDIDNADYAWGWSFAHGCRANLTRDESYSVRAVRSF